MTDRTRHLSARTIGLYSVASIGGGFFYVFNNAVLPLLLQAHTSSVLLINLLSNTRSMEGAVIQPVVGAWSDRIWTRLGRRRPFMLIAMPLSALFMALTPLAPNLALIVVCIVLFSLLFNVAADPYTALQADIAAPAQRPMLNAVATVVQLAGQVSLGLFLSPLGPFKKTIPPAAYAVVAAGMLLTFLVTIVGVPERREDVHLEPRHRLGEYVAALQGHRQALRYLVALFFYNVGINTIQVNLTRFAVYVLGISGNSAIFLFVLLILVTGLLALPAAWLATRVGLKRVIGGGMVLIAVAATFAMVVRTEAQVIPVLLLAGVGNAGLTLTWPLLTLLVPPERVGVFAGLKTSAESISAFFSGFVAAAMVGIWGYRSIFMVLLVAIVAALATLITVRVGLPAPSGAPSASG
jgi:Na+/melibiose symporter-like transporter